MPDKSDNSITNNVENTPTKCHAFCKCGASLYINFCTMKQAIRAASVFWTIHKGDGHGLVSKEEHDRIRQKQSRVSPHHTMN